MINIETLKEDQITILVINGEVDASSSIQLDESLGSVIGSGEPKILIDCTSLNYISSAGLGVFMSYIEDINSKQLKVVLFGLNEKVFNVFGILGLDQLLTLVSTKEEAIKLVNEA
ncbi:MAG: STAS domain-containing protein [Bacteroidota bacterium]